MRKYIAIFAILVIVDIIAAIVIGCALHVVVGASIIVSIACAITVAIVIIGIDIVQCADVT
jgi:hypothetical protein